MISRRTALRGGTAVAASAALIGLAEAPPDIRAGLDPREVIPHTMRHTAVTNLAATGADIPTIQVFSGHLNLKMVMRYAHARDRRVDEAVDRMEKAKTKVEQIAPSKTGNS